MVLVVNSIGQEINGGDRVLTVSRSGSYMDFKIGRVSGFGERKAPGYGRKTEPTVLIEYENREHGKSRGVGLDRVFKLA